MFHGIDTDDHREDYHIDTETNENCETHKSIFICFCVIAYFRDERVHYRVEKCVIDNDYNGGRDVVDLVELLEYHVVFADLVILKVFVFVTIS
jgi:hypothetical protein